MNDIHPTIDEQAGVTGYVRITAYKAGTKEVVRQTPWMKNTIMNSSNRGKNLIVQRLCAINDYSLNILYGEIGTSTGTPTATDLGLGTPVARSVTTLASVGVALNVAQLQFFFADSQLPDGTYTEFGTFVDGNSGTATGQLFNHALFNTAYTKGTGEDTTVEVDFTLT